MATSKAIYPSGFTTMNHYNSKAIWKKWIREDTGVVVWQAGNDINEQLEQQQLGNGLTIDKTYVLGIPDGYIEQIRTESQQHVVQDLGFALVPLEI